MINFYAKHLINFQELTNYRRSKKLPKYTTRFHLITKPQKRSLILEYLKMKDELMNSLETDLEKHIYNDPSLLKVFFLLIYLKCDKNLDILNLNTLLNLVDAYQMNFYKLIEYWKLFLVLKFFKTRIMQNSMHENMEILTVRHIFNRKNLFTEDILNEVVREYEGNVKDINFALNFLKYYDFENKPKILIYLNGRIKRSKLDITEDINQNVSEESLSVHSESNVINSSESESFEGNYEKFNKKLISISERYNIIVSSDTESKEVVDSSDGEGKVVVDSSDTESKEAVSSFKTHIQEVKKMKKESLKEQINTEIGKNEIVVFKGIKFEKVKFLGSGGTAQVFLVKPINHKELHKINIHENSAKSFALKTIYVTTVEMSKNLINEIKLMQSFANKEDLNEHIIKLYDYEIKNDAFLILMEAGDMDLWTYLSSKKCLHNKLFKGKDALINLDDGVTVDKYDFLKDNSVTDNLENEERSKTYNRDECESSNCKFHWPFTSNCSSIDSYAYLSLDELNNLLEMLLSIFEQLANNCIIHRDIKHKNFVFINRKLKLIDFGLSRKVSEEKSQHNTQEAGTYSFMSPESILNKEVSRKSDIWALGNLIHEIIFGELKFKGNGKSSIFGFLNTHKSDSVDVGFCKNDCPCKSSVDIFEEIFFNSKNMNKENLLMTINRTGEQIYYKNLIEIPKYDMCNFHKQFKPLRCYVPYIFLIKKCLIVDPKKRFGIFDLIDFFKTIQKNIQCLM